MTTTGPTINKNKRVDSSTFYLNYVNFLNCVDLPKNNIISEKEFGCIGTKDALADGTWGNIYLLNVKK